jgi:hypothetical protein
MMARAIKRYAALLSVSCVLAGPTANAAKAVNRTPYDSFLWSQVGSVHELVNEIQTNPKIAARYAKLYHVSQGSLETYFSNNLEILRLTHPMHGSIYCVKPNGAIFVTHGTLKAGSKIFALRDGRPVLEWACGNPLTASLPAHPPTRVMAGNVNYSGGKNKRRRAALVPTNGHNAKNHGLPITEHTVDNWTPTNVVTPTEYVSPYSATFPNNPTPTFGGPEDFNVPVGGSAPFSFPIGAAFAALPFTLLHGSGGGGGGSFTPAAAPEASTMIMWPAVGLLLAGYAAILRKRRKLPAD